MNGEKTYLFFMIILLVYFLQKRKKNNVKYLISNCYYCYTQTLNYIL